METNGTGQYKALAEQFNKNMRCMETIRGDKMTIGDRGLIRT